MPPDPITTTRPVLSRAPTSGPSLDMLQDPLVDPLTLASGGSSADAVLPMPAAGLDPLDAEQRVWRKLTGEELDEQLFAEATDPEAISPLLHPGEGEDGYTVKVGDDRYVYDLPVQDDLLQRDLVGPRAHNFLSRAMVEDGADGEEVIVLTPDGKQVRLPANEHGMVELPESGFGFTTYRRNDVTVDGRPQPDQYGSPDLISRLMNTATDYATLFPGDGLNIGDLSTDTGDSPLLDTGESRRHKSHFDGSMVDLRYTDGSGSMGPVDANQANAVDMGRQQALIDLASAWGMRRFNHGKSLSNKLKFPPGVSAVPDATTEGEHHHHLHMGR